MKYKKEYVDTALFSILASLIVGIFSTYDTIYVTLGLVLGLIINQKVFYFPSKLLSFINNILHFISTNIILFIIFYFVIFPISLFKKVLKSNYDIKLNSDEPTGYLKVSKKFDSNFFKRSF